MQWLCCFSSSQLSGGAQRGLLGVGRGDDDAEALLAHAVVALRNQLKDLDARYLYDVHTFRRKGLVQGSARRRTPGCVSAVGKVRQKR